MSVIPLVEDQLFCQEAEGANYTPFLHQCSVLRVFKAQATRIREKSKQVYMCEVTKVYATDLRFSSPSTNPLSRTCSLKATKKMNDYKRFLMYSFE
jgi:hypothetical protein